LVSYFTFNFKKNLITGIAQEIGDCIGKKERIVPLFRRLNELEKHLEPASATESGLSLEARAEVILNEEKQLRQTNNLLEQVKSKKSVLDSETLKNVASMEGKLLELTKLHLDQQSQCEDWSNEALDLVEQYNGLIDTLTQTFVEYDKVLTAAEEAAEIK
jgi:hypothetical protein